MSKSVLFVVFFCLLIGIFCSPTGPNVDEHNNGWLCYPYYVSQLDGNYYDVYIALSVEKFSDAKKPFAIGLDKWNDKDVVLLHTANLSKTFDGKSYLFHVVMIGGETYYFRAGKRWCGMYSDSTLWLDPTEMNRNKFARGSQFSFYVDTITDLVVPVSGSSCCD